MFLNTTFYERFCIFSRKLCNYLIFLKKESDAFEITILCVCLSVRPSVYISLSFCATPFKPISNFYEI
jgi:hypothetical protein